MDNIEKLVLEAAQREGQTPSFDNLPDVGEIIRVRTDENTGTKYNEFFSKQSFIKSMGRRPPGFARDEPEDRRRFMGAGFPESALRQKEPSPWALVKFGRRG